MRPSRRAEDSDFLRAYLPHGGPVGIHMDKVSGKQMKARVNIAMFPAFLAAR